MASRRGEFPPFSRPRASKPGSDCDGFSAVNCCPCLFRLMPSIGARCHELRINDGGTPRRLVYRIDTDAIVILEVFAKKTGATPKAVIATCRERLKEYENAGK